MTQLKFMRTTHDDDGRCLPFPPEAWQFWREHGAAVGVILRLESPLTLAEIVTVSREYALEYPESGAHADLTDKYVAWCLLKLCEAVMATVVIHAEIHSYVLYSNNTEENKDLLRPQRKSRNLCQPL